MQQKATDSLTNYNPEFEGPITYQEVEKEIKQIKHRKASGNDDIQAHGRPTVKKWLHRIC